MKESLKKKVFGTGVLLVFAIFLLDWLIAGRLFFLFPNELEWDTSPWYNFVHHNSKIDFKDQKGVIITGSSVALFSALPEEIENSLDGSARVTFYSHVAMSSADLNYYLDDIIAKKPAVVMYLVNPADFQLDHFRESGGRLEYSKEAWLNEYKWRFPVKTFYPVEFIRGFYQDLSRRDLYFMLSKASLYMNRYRFFMMDPVTAWIERHLRSGRSYHNYTGSVPHNGIWARGWTQREFTVNCDLDNGMFKNDIFLPLAGTVIEVKSGNRSVFKKTYKNPGWKKISFSLGDNSRQAVLNFSTDKTVSSRVIDEKIYGREYIYGIRLSQNFCKKTFATDIAYIRPLTLEDERFPAMTQTEYKADYYDRMFRDFDKRPELSRLRLISDTKERLAAQEFKEWIELEYLARTASRLKQAGIRFVLVNNPENPLELEKYAGGKWYAGLMHYLGNLDGVRFYDMKDTLTDPRMFIDYHHLTMYGARTMTSRYSAVLRRNLEE